MRRNVTDALPASVRPPAGRRSVAAGVAGPGEKARLLGSVLSPALPAALVVNAQPEDERARPGASRDGHRLRRRRCAGPTRRGRRALQSRCSLRVGWWVRTSRWVGESCSWVSSAAGRIGSRVGARTPSTPVTSQASLTQGGLWDPGETREVRVKTAHLRGTRLASLGRRAVAPDICE